MKKIGRNSRRDRRLGKDRAQMGLLTQKTALYDYMIIL